MFALAPGPYLHSKLTSPSPPRTSSSARRRRYPNQVFFALLLSSAHTLPYTTNNFFYWLCDEFKWFQGYKLERKEYMKAKPALMTKMATEALIGQLVTGPIFAYLLYPAFVHFGMLDLDAPLPTFASMFKTFVVGYTFNDVGFYFTHRLFHSKLLYKRFHKQHHEFVGTVSFSAEYADPVEIIIANQIPTVGGVLFFACHPLSVSVWIMMRLQQTYEAHSGYCFENTLLAKVGILHPGSAVFHDHHHTSNMGNFGSFFLDWAFGTMDHYLSAGGYRGYIDKKKKGGV
ncbi:hypothetical protein TL16_g10031 [Triparma laevis f. inornata]|uniref:Fatty acid hydroxylase domain-containing protein n=1 Tax=Triparma laevis f. inornata TaxID=1714386 RepID=A0A9W7EP24_9STRA|nr:hypothetical protein TL16_g10031 [Triparma laevis f. inornata]